MRFRLKLREVDGRQRVKRQLRQWSSNVQRTEVHREETHRLQQLAHLCLCRRVIPGEELHALATSEFELGQHLHFKMVESLDNAGTGHPLAEHLTGMLPPRSMTLMPQAASGLLGSLESGELGSRNSTGLVASITMRLFQAARPPKALPRSCQRTATNTMSARAASSTLAAWMDGPFSVSKGASEAGPRRLAIRAVIDAAQ